MRTEPQEKPQQRTQCLDTIMCKFGKNIVGDAGGPLAVRLGENIIRKRHIGKNQSWQGRHLKKTTSYDGMKQRYTEERIMECLKNSIIQTSLDFSPIWIPLTSKAINK